MKQFEDIHISCSREKGEDGKEFLLMLLTAGTPKVSDSSPPVPRAAVETTAGTLMMPSASNLFDPSRPVEHTAIESPALDGSDDTYALARVGVHMILTILNRWRPVTDREREEPLISVAVFTAQTSEHVEKLRKFRANPLRSKSNL